jgi:hypothetical protein
MMAIDRFLPLARSIAHLTPTALRSHLTSSPTPLHLPNLLTSSPAITSWRLSDGLDRLRRSVGEDRLVEVELVKRGRGYLHPEHTRVYMPFGQSPSCLLLPCYQC